MKTFLIFITILSYSGLLFAKKLDLKKRLMVEYQNSILEESTTNSMAYGSFGFDLSLFDHTIKSNAYINHSQSSLFEESPAIMNQIIAPRIITTRDLFRFEELQTGDASSSQGTLNQFEWAYGDDEIQFYAGRMWLDFGTGKTINPINPFQTSTFFSNLYGINQAVDGIRWQIQRDEKLKLHIYVLGDKRFSDYDEKITNTAMIRGEWKKSKATTINYILGEDQRRLKYGGEIKHKLEWAHLYGQLMKFNERQDLQTGESQNLTHWMMGSEFQINSLQRVTIEVGKLQKDRLLLDNDEFQLSLLPLEDFVMLELVQEMEEQGVYGSVRIISDTKSNFGFIQFNANIDIYNNVHLRFFTSHENNEPKDEVQYNAQRDFPNTTTGLALRTRF